MKPTCTWIILRDKLGEGNWGNSWLKASAKQSEGRVMPSVFMTANSTESVVFKGDALLVIVFWT